MTLSALLGALTGFIVNAVSYLWPSYSSYKALEAHAGVDVWLTYWIILGFLCVIEHWCYFFLSVIPLYLLFKLAFIIWLQLPQTQVRESSIFLSVLYPWTSNS
jgi:receptor expression-enhancing protein 5/6